MFLEHITESFHFPGEHTPTAEEINAYHVPLIKKMLEQTYIPRQEYNDVTFLPMAEEVSSRVKEQKPVKPVETPKEVKAVEPAPEAPKKRVRQRIRITSATPVREKVEFFKKK